MLPDLKKFEKGKRFWSREYGFSSPDGHLILECEINETRLYFHSESNAMWTWPNGALSTLLISVYTRHSEQEHNECDTHT